MFYVYILYSDSADRYYVGFCSELTSRLAKHNAGSTPSTRPYRPWRIVHAEEYPTKTEAIVREKEIKRKKSRKYIEAMIGKD